MTIQPLPNSPSPQLPISLCSLLSVENLTVEFRTRSGVVKALAAVDFTVQPGETVGIVGESGSGKSVTAFTLMGVLDRAGKVTAGRALLQTEAVAVDLLKESEASLRQIRGREISMIFQNPRTALNPIRKVGKQITDVLRCHTDLPPKELPGRALELLASVRIPDPPKRYDAYPYELSGGLCQRIMIALALACSPKLLIADEPTTGLDVTTQATVMTLIQDLAEQGQMATLLITHDLALASEYCDRIVVMHAGHVVESAPTHTLFSHPRHPYTAKLIAATPEPHKSFADLTPIPGSLPDLKATTLPPCRFSQRCDRFEAGICDQTPLVREFVNGDHHVACWKPL
ncbi:ABC transporter protein [Halomicronema hongdechloris C2206]|uniref:ABC transporter protein n=1 Tax=Halomicronema hongdechloris C2206 TaxID=1641165 RepID=A0A1Z3HG92_9CYAN|nr:ABC transporter ATP-binding protein [Halomicronema hongdechloris]ASC69320.1 ABC transporter protein [Halomicronema hongdechloris C2206]